MSTKKPSVFDGNHKKQPPVFDSSSKNRRLFLVLYFRNYGFISSQRNELKN